MSLFLASAFTLGYFVASVLAVLMALAYATDIASFAAVAAFTVLVNLVMWLVGPVITDFVMRWFHSLRFLSPEEARAQPWWPFFERVCAEHRIRPPRLGVIDDANPTAFTYGSTANRARVVVTRGLLADLTQPEVEAVLAHELGHVVHRDFIVMTIASTLLQVLYQLYSSCMRAAGRMKSGGRKNNPAGFLIAVGLGALVLYAIGTWLLLFLSRTREYAADEFAARTVGDGNVLSSALLKIAYGIAAAPDTERTADLLRATRAQGVFDLTHARGVALIRANAAEKPGTIERALLWDLASPWAWLVQLRSTHPLIGRRIARLMRASPKPAYDFAAIRAQAPDATTLYAGFLRDIALWSLPWLAVLAFGAAVLAHAAWPEYGLMPGAAVVFVGAFVGAMWLRLAMRYPSDAFAAANVLDCLGDLHASPIRGRAVALSGAAIGRGTPGAIFSEDMMFRDRSGLIFLNYESALPLFGNLYFAWAKLEALLDRPAVAKGWFLRGATHHLELHRFECGDTVVKSRVRMWAWIGAIMAMVGAVAAAVLLAAPELVRLP